MSRLAVLVWGMAVIALPATVRADGSLAGVVRTAAGAPVPHLVLVLEGPTEKRTILTGAEGRYRAEALPAGAYALTLDAPGFTLTLEPPRLTIGDGETALDLVLAAAPVRERIVVSATRDEAALSTVGVTASSLEGDEVAERESSDLLHLLQTVPGVAVARTGGLGAQAATFVRGGASNFTRILIDGVPANEPGGAYNFSGFLPLEIERIEVVRGAASSLYGTDALAGVIHVVTRRAPPGEGPSFRAEAEAGTYSWSRFGAGTSGQRGRLDWNLGLARVETDNHAPNSAFDEVAAAGSFGARLGSATSLRLTLRGEDGEAGTPGQTAFGRPDLDASIERSAWVAGAEARHLRGRLAHSVRVGLARTRQLSLNPLDSGSYTPRFGDRVGAFPFSDFTNPAGFQNDTERLTLGYGLEADAGRRHLVGAGVDVERETGDLGSRAEELLTPERTNVGAYVQDRIVLGDRLFVTVGGRLERNASFGTEAVPRAAVAWRVRGGEKATTLRASAGMGIKEPTLPESYGVSLFAQGNPDLKPERSRTLDLGVEQRWRDRLRFQATLFRHDYRDQIGFQILDFTTFQGSYANIGQSRAQGAELALEAAPVRSVRLAADYTYLDGEVLASTSDFDPVYAVGRELLRRPREQGSLSARVGSERLNAGATWVWVGQRADSDFAGINLEENEGYTRLDARVHGRLFRGLEAFAVAENLLDRDYMEVLGYPAPGRVVRAGLRFRSQGAR